MSSGISLTYSNSKIVLLFCLCIVTMQSFAVSEKKNANSNQKYQDSLLTISKITIHGNKKTKEAIILRELTVKPDNLTTQAALVNQLKISKQNLINTSLFNNIKIDYLVVGRNVEITIELVERWYLWPELMMDVQDRNFNTWWRTKDMYRINYGAYLTLGNLTGNNDALTLKYRKGYSELIGATYKMPYLNKSKTLQASVSAYYMANNEIAFNTYGNQLLFYRSYTHFVRKEQEYKFNISYRPVLYQRVYADIKYNSSQISDTITKLNKDYFIKGKNNINYTSLTVGYNFEFVDNKAYPKKGTQIDAAVTQNGLDLLPNENISNSSFSFSFRQYIPLGKRFNMSGMIKYRSALNNYSGYYFQRALGYQDFVRGYEYYVIDGQDYFLCKSNVGFQLFKTRYINFKDTKVTQKFNHIPYTFYLRAYSDLGYVQDYYNKDNNPLTNSLLKGYGIGLDFVSYYDYVLRAEFSINDMKQKGIYLHFSAPL